MKTYNFRECPCEISGIPFFEKGGSFRRLTDEIVKEIPALADADRRTPNARLRFRTDTKSLTIKVKVENVYVDRGFAYYQSNVGNVFVGHFDKSAYAGILTADKSYDENEVYGTFTLDGSLNEITVFLPHKPTIKDIEITIDDDAEIFKPLPYTISKPILFYGSSIVENGHTSNMNSYTALISRFLDADFINMGFSGLARGEQTICDYIAKIDCCAFVMDYDHNAPSAEHLERTHYPFYKRYRELHPDTPIIMMSKPSDDLPDTAKRKEIILNTYNKAVAEGDKNVRFIDGLSYFGEYAPVCTTDRTHPNELGHFFMAQKITAVLRELLDI